MNTLPARGGELTMPRTIVASALIVLLAAPLAHGATVRGIVAGWNSPTLGDARVTLSNTDTSIVLENRSAIDGTYRFENVSAGTWLVGASRLGYAYRESL